ncbi:hypothetical protein H0266_14100 [Halobacillus locisalis]|uniref:Lipoprotein n=1 Tax=Halobacillus locisalis TaxID=220753 RepID=A0A838CW83_9BACI|nr:hypothetical protein [Halobacillus locisalis]MBA2176025.1 hypothetical protein [Halobacillus locisalis]
MRIFLGVLFLSVLIGCQSTYTIEEDFPVSEEVVEVNMKTGGSANTNLERAQTDDPEKIDELLSVINELSLFKIEGDEMRAHHELMQAVPSLEVSLSRSSDNAPYFFTIAEGGQGMFLSFDGGSTDVGYMTETFDPEVYQKLKEIYDTLYVQTTRRLEIFNLGERMKIEKESGEATDLIVEATFEIYQEEEALKADPTNLEVRLSDEEMKLIEQSEPERTSATQFEQRISVEHSSADQGLSGKVIWDVKDYEEIEIRFDAEGEA